MFNRIKELNLFYSIYEPVLRTQIIGSILIVTAIVLLINPNSLNIKISFSSIILGILSMILVKKTKNNNDIKNNNNLSEKIIMILGIWIIILLVLTRNVGIDVLVISIFIGILVIKELTDEFTTKYQKNVLNIFIFTFLLIFILIIGQKIISISSF